jgi:hypothetical protein
MSGFLWFLSGLSLLWLSMFAVFLYNEWNRLSEILDDLERYDDIDETRFK